MALDLSALDDDSPPAAPQVAAAESGAPARAPLQMFEEDPDNPRFETNVTDFDALVADIQSHGILQPLVVRREADGKLRVRFGSRRLRAAKRAGLAEAPYVVTEDPRQFDDYAQVAENERRSPLQPLELATFIAKKLAQGETRREVARHLHLDPSAVTHLLALVGEVPRFVLELYHSGKCRTPQYLYHLRRLSKGRIEEVARRCAVAVDIDRRFLMSIGEGTAREAALASASDDIAAVGTGGQANVPGPASKGKKIQDGSALPPAVGQTAYIDENLHPRLLGPCLLAQYRQEEVLLLLTLKPSSPARIIVRHADGRAEEVAIANLSLRRILESEESGAV